MADIDIPHPFGVTVKERIFLVEASPVAATGSTIVVYIGDAFVKGAGDVPIYRLRITGGASGVVDNVGNTMAANYDLFLSF